MRDNLDGEIEENNLDVCGNSESKGERVEE